LKDWKLSKRHWRVKKGILLLLSILALELMGLMSKVVGNPIAVIARTIKKNRWVDQLVAEVRRGTGLGGHFH